MTTTVTSPAPRLSRFKTLIAALLATLAIAGAVEASVPDSASARASRTLCVEYFAASDYWRSMGQHSLADLFMWISREQGCGSYYIAY
jgi:hypothetical protein